MKVCKSGVCADLVFQGTTSLYLICISVDDSELVLYSMPSNSKRVVLLWNKVFHFSRVRLLHLIILCQPSSAIAEFGIIAAEHFNCKTQTPHFTVSCYIFSLSQILSSQSDEMPNVRLVDVVTIPLSDFKEPHLDDCGDLVSHKFLPSTKSWHIALYSPCSLSLSVIELFQPKTDVVSLRLVAGGSVNSEKYSITSAWTAILSSACSSKTGSSIVCIFSNPCSTELVGQFSEVTPDSQASFSPIPLYINLSPLLHVDNKSLKLLDLLSSIVSESPHRLLLSLLVSSCDLIEPVYFYLLLIIACPSESNVCNVVRLLNIDPPVLRPLESRWVLFSVSEDQLRQCLLNVSLTHDDCLRLHFSSWSIEDSLQQDSGSTVEATVVRSVTLPGDVGLYPVSIDTKNHFTFKPSLLILLYKGSDGYQIFFS
ncbi:unnamed protein product [Calicophoron daubneyi]